MFLFISRNVIRECATKTFQQNYSTRNFEIQHHNIYLVFTNKLHCFENCFKIRQDFDFLEIQTLVAACFLLWPTTRIRLNPFVILYNSSFFCSFLRFACMNSPFNICKHYLIYIWHLNNRKVIVEEFIFHFGLSILGLFGDQEHNRWHEL